MSSANERMRNIQKVLEQTTSTKPAPIPSAVTAPVKADVAPSRVGKIHIGAYLHQDFKRSLRMVQAATGDDIQALIARALNELFRAHNVPVVDQD